MATAPNDRVMTSERIAPGILPRVPSSFDMVVVFVAVVLFIVNASAIQGAGRAAILVGVSTLVAVAIYAISQLTHRRELAETSGPHPTATAAGG